MTATGRPYWLADWRFGVPLALLVSACCLTLALLAYYLTGERFVRSTALAWQGEAFELVEGQGSVNHETLLITRLSNRQMAMANVPLKRLLSAQDYTQLVWDLEAPDSRTGLRFVWITEEAPQVLHGVVLPPADQGGANLSLGEVPGWQGKIVSMSLEVNGVLRKPLVLRKLALQPRVLGPMALLGRIGREWTTFEGWRGSSINVLSRNQSVWLLPLVLAVAAWIGLAGLLLSLVTGCRLQCWLPLFLLGWLVLDIRWQGELWHTLELAHERYAGKTGDNRQRAAPDGRLYDLITGIKRVLPEQPVRLLLLTAKRNDIDRYINLRARYHLLPHNVLSRQGLSGLDGRLRALNSGDYLLVIGSVPGLNFRPNTHTLTWEGKQSRLVDRLLGDRSAALYQLR